MYVSPEGDDTAAGVSSRAPFASLRRARDEVRRIRRAIRGGTGTARVLLAPGTYPLRETLELGPEDGDAEWIGAGASLSIVSGGIPLADWSRAEEGADLWQARLPPAAASLSIAQLWIDGGRCKM